MRIAYADGVDSARIAPGEVARLAGGDASEARVLLGWAPAPPLWVDDPTVRGVTIMGGYGLADAIASGRLRYLPVRLSTLPAMLAGPLRPDVAVVSAIRRGKGCAFRSSVGWGPAAIANAGVIVAEIDPDAPDLGAPMIERVDHVVERPPDFGAPPSPRSIEPVDLAIGRAVVAMLPDDPVLQLGLGGVPEAVLACLDRPVSIRSGLVSESMAELHGRGLLSGVLRGGYAWGGRAIEELAAAGRLVLEPVEATHDVGALAEVERFVACNTALQVGLDGSVNVERVGGRIVAGVGGHTDYSEAATRSPGGLSVIALRSTTRRGQSTIVPRVELVSTPPRHVGVVVTEHGAADLRGVAPRERARRLVAVADSAHRAELAAWLDAWE